MDTRPIEELSFNELCRDLTEQFMNGIVRGEPIGRNVRGVAEAAVYWRSEKTKAEEKAKAQVEPKPHRWPNGCDKTVPEALRYLARNERPQGGESRFNAAHLEQLAQEIEALADAQNSCR